MSWTPISASFALFVAHLPFLVLLGRGRVRGRALRLLELGEVLGATQGTHFFEFLVKYVCRDADVAGECDKHGAFQLVKVRQREVEDARGSGIYAHEVDLGDHLEGEAEANGE